MTNARQQWPQKCLSKARLWVSSLPFVDMAIDQHLQTWHHWNCHWYLCTKSTCQLSVIMTWKMKNLYNIKTCIYKVTTTAALIVYHSWLLLMDKKCLWCWETGINSILSKGKNPCSHTCMAQQIYPFGRTWGIVGKDFFHALFLPRCCQR